MPRERFISHDSRRRVTVHEGTSTCHVKIAKLTLFSDIRDTSGEHLTKNPAYLNKGLCQSEYARTFEHTEKS